MSTAELRKQLIERIKRSRRPELLREALRLMGKDTHDLDVYKVTPEQRKAIAKGLKAAAQGKVISAIDADRAIDKWLSEYSGQRQRSLNAAPFSPIGASGMATRNTAESLICASKRIAHNRTQPAHRQTFIFRARAREDGR